MTVAPRLVGGARARVPPPSRAGSYGKESDVVFLDVRVATGESHAFTLCLGHEHAIDGVAVDHRTPASVGADVPSDLRKLAQAEVAGVSERFVGLSAIACRWLCDNR